MLGAFTVVSVFNLALFLSKHAEIGQRLQSYFLASQRNSAYRLLLLELSLIHQAALEPNESSNYTGLFKEHLVDARELT